MDRYELRRQDYRLSDSHTDLQQAYRQLLSAHCGIEVVRAAEKSGFDRGLWERLCATGATTMALPESAGGDGATLVDLTLVAEELGRALAPVPWIDHVCAARLLAGLGRLDPAVLAGNRIVALDPCQRAVRAARLVPAAAAADLVITRDGDDIVALRLRTRPGAVANIAHLPMAWIDPAAADERTVLATGPAAHTAYQRALDEWRLLTAAALVGLVDQAMTIAAEFAKTRHTLGVPIATLQAISHPLANMAVTVVGGRNLARRAAWHLDNEPGARPELAGSAFVFMAEEAAKAATMATHIQGGLGVSDESAAPAYLVRARGWALAGGDPADTACRIAELAAARETAPPGTEPTRVPLADNPMDFSLVELAADDLAFVERAREFLNTQVTEQVRRRERDTGDGFDETVHLAMGAAGYLRGELTSPAKGGFTRLQRRLWQQECRRAHAPWLTWSVTAMLTRAVKTHARPDLRDEVLPKILDGTVRVCMGYTEPEGGSDIATSKTRAVRDGDDWIINGQKMFTTSAHNCQYVFLITNTDPAAPKHKSLTMFLVPLDTPGVAIHPVRTVDGDRTNITYYSDVRVSDRYRLGEVNNGWRVLSEPLNAEHGATDAAVDGLDDLAVMAVHSTRMAVAVDTAAALVARPDGDGTRPLDDRSVTYRLGRAIARVEAALSTPGIHGRVAIGQTMRDITPDLMDLLGTAASLPAETDGAADNGAAEYLYRWAPLTGIYGGTLEVFRNMIAQHTLGLGKPAYAPPKPKTIS